MTSEAFECEIMSWDLFNELAKKVAGKMKEDNYNPDFMVGLARGGWVLSRVLCDYIGIKDLVSLKVEHWGVTATPDGKAQIKYPIDVDLTGRHVVVVDDITDTGESMKVAIEYIKKLNPKTLRTAALRNIEGSSFTPDYYGDEIKWRWVVFPWNFVEDMCNIVPKATEGAKNILEVQRNLKERHGVELSILEIEEINEEVERRK
jgi:hypoxanthine phosphoribosyltransferase